MRYTIGELCGGLGKLKASTRADGRFDEIKESKVEVLIKASAM